MRRTDVGDEPSDMGSAIREAEDRKSLSEAIENGWPITRSKQEGDISCQ